MATAAPAAPAAPTSTGAAPSAGGEGTQVAQPTTPQAPARKIAPIPPTQAKPAEGKPEPTAPARKPHIGLPGVISNRPDDPSNDLFPKLGPSRDPKTGQFTGTKPDLPEGASPAPAEGKPPAPGEQTPKQGVKFLGKDYKDIAEVEQLHRTLQGNHRSQLDAVRKATEERDYGYQAAHAWKAEFERVSNELEALKQGRAPQATPAASPATSAQPGAAIPQSGFNLDEALKGIDTDAFELIATNPQGGLAAAARYLVAETLKVAAENMLPQMLSKFDARLQPLEGDVQSRTAQGQQLATIEMVASLKTPSGQPAFPELGDARTVEEIGELWGRTYKRQGWTVQDVQASLMTPEGIIQAISLYRTMKGFMPPDEPAPAPANPRTEPAPAAPAPGASASMLEEPGTSRTPGGERSTLSPEAQRLVNALENTQLVDPKLGFTKNPRPR